MKKNNKDKKEKDIKKDKKKDIKKDKLFNKNNKKENIIAKLFKKKENENVFTKLFKKKDKKIINDNMMEYLSCLYYVFLGFILCLSFLFFLSGGKNYLKIYSDLRKLIDVYDEVDKNYYGDLSKNEIVDGAIAGMLNGVGDNYTTYSDVNSTNEFNDDLNATYEGIGCTVTTNDDNKIVVVSVFDDSPAKKAGIKKDDIFIKVDGEDFSNSSSDQISDYIRNNKKSELKITLIRDGEEMELKVKRNKVQMPTVSGEIVEKDNHKIGYMYISVFSSVTASQFKKELKKMEKKGIEGLVIDVRDNTGGYLSSVTDISSMFLKKGKVIYKLKRKKGVKVYKDKTKEYRNYPVSILINNSSASASEILASAIKESYGGEVVGVNSFGKGTVQKTRQLKDGTMIKYTIQNWLTPNGKWINKKGVTPTIKVEFDKDGTEDNQYNKAIESVISNIKK